MLDIPRSLELSNGGGRIHAAKAPDEQYQTPEPKGKKREAFILALPAKHVKYHDLLQTDIRRAMEACCPSHDLTEWCFPRIQSVQVVDETLLTTTATDIDTKREKPLPIILSTLPNDFASEEDISHEVVLNQNAHPTHIRLSNGMRILVPGVCAFLWTDIAYGLKIFQEYTTGSELQFDMILMDPPWSNRSVRNGAKYLTIENQTSNPFEYALTIVEKLGSPKGYVAVWITNKAAVHEQVTQSLMFLKFSLVEEWVWTKVTIKGEPVTRLDGVWRRPYEILLVFRHDICCSTPLRRYIHAVPDIHSRKPNLKEMFSRLMQPTNVLEIFARNLTSGWWCIGNEVLEFQRQGAWHKWPREIGDHIPGTDLVRDAVKNDA